MSRDRIGQGRSVKVRRLPSCDFCNADDDQRGSPRFSAARYDGKTTAGPWANMCERHFRVHGVGLGTGRGQKFLLTKEALS